MRNFWAKPQVVVGIVRIPVVDVDLAVVRIEVDTRDVAARGSLLPYSFRITENLFQDFLRPLGVLRS